jgi:hypothetical protein
LKAKASELNDLGDEDFLDEADDDAFEDLADEVSRMGIGSDDEDAETVGFKSVRFTSDTKSILGGGIARKKRDHHLQPVLPYILDKWTDEHLRPRVSIQIHGISGNQFKQLTEQRVSTDQQYFCHSWPLSKWQMTPERAFNAHILNRDDIKNDQTGITMRLYKQILAHCSKTIARRKVISKLKGRDASKEKIMQEMRIPLPFKVQHRYVTKEEDPLFYGKQWIKYPNGEYHCHVELIGIQKDSYSPMKDCASVRSAKSAFVGMEGEIPTDISFEIKGGDDDDDDDDMDDSTWKTLKSSLEEESEEENDGMGSVTPSELKSITSKKSKLSTKSKISMKSAKTARSNKRQKTDENGTGANGVGNMSVS